MCSTTSGLRQVPGWQLSDDAVEQALAALDVNEAALVARRAELLHQVEVRGMKDRTQALSVERWLQDRFRLSHRDAKTRVAQARLLTGQPVAHDALAAGRVTPEQASIVATALDAVDQLDGVDAVEREDAGRFLVEQSSGLVPRELAVVAQHLVEQLTRRPSLDTFADAGLVARELAAAEAAAQAAEISTLVVKRHGDGSVTGRFRLRPVDAPVLSAWLKQADARHPGEDGFEDDRPREQRRGDHLTTTLRNSLATRDTGDSGETGGGSGAGRTFVHVNVTTTLDALRDAVTGAGTLDSGGTLSASELRRLACDAGITPLVLGGPSQVLDYGRTRRTFPQAPRRAMVVRDRGCVAPGCDRAPDDCDGHHQTEWDHGGPTDLANGALLCPFHHQQVHRQGWQVRLARNGYPELVPPRSVDPEQRPRQHHRFTLTDLTRRRPA